MTFLPVVEMYKSSVENGRKWVLAGCKHSFICMRCQPGLLASLLILEVGTGSLWDVSPLCSPSGTLSLVTSDGVLCSQVAALGY